MDDVAETGPDLRANEVDGLRVVDASVIPDLAGEKFNAILIVITEKAGDLIRYWNGRQVVCPSTLSLVQLDVEDGAQEQSKFRKNDTWSHTENVIVRRFLRKL